MSISKSIRSIGIILWILLKLMAKVSESRQIDKMIIDLLLIEGHYTHLLLLFSQNLNRFKRLIKNLSIEFNAINLMMKDSLIQELN